MHTNRLLSAFAIPFFFAILICSCSKNDSPPPSTDPVVTDTLIVDNKWECQVDGVMYSGTVDTSFIAITNTGINDTTITCNGTSADKKSNIHFRLSFSRRFGIDTTATRIPGHGLFIFDTTYNLPLIASSRSNEVNVTYKIEAFRQNKIRISFSGTAKSNNYADRIHTVTSGRFSCEIGKGDNEPKTFSFTSNNNNYAGYVNVAKVVSNTLILEGTPYLPDGVDKFRLIVRTRGILQPGTYTSIAGNAGLQYFIPSIQLYYVNDTLGNLSVNIESVSDKIVTGTFSGTSKDGQSIVNGKFNCRVNSYTPQAESINQWSFGLDSGNFLYNLYAGNTLTAQRSLSGYPYQVTVNGVADNGISKFKLVISSGAAITTGIYQSTLGSYNHVDSLYYIPNPALLSFNDPTSFMTSSSGIINTYCVVDSIDSQKITGRFFGYVSIPYTSNGFSTAELKKGKFRATF